MEIIRSYNLYLNSSQASIGGTSNNCTFNISPAITLTNRQNRFLVSIPFLEVPYSFNQISSSYNTLQYSFTDPSGSFNSTLTINEGNYNITQWISAFTTAINKDITIQRPFWLSTYITIVYNVSTGLCTFIMTAPTTSITLSLSQNYVMALMFGFPRTNQTFSNSIVLTSVNKVLANPINSIFLRSDSLKFETSFEAVVAPYSQADILARVPVTTLPNSWLYYRSEHKQLLSNVDITTINLYWSDNINPLYILDLKGLPFGCQMTLEEVQIKPNNAFKDMISRDVPVAIPKQFILARDKVLQELLDERDKLEKEINEQKKKEI